MKKINYLVLFFILLIALIFRLYKINIPLADFHSWRQADTAAVARNFIRNGFDLLHPKYDDLSNIQSGIDNPQGYRMVEFPIYNAIFAFLAKNFSFLSLEVWGRLTSIFFSLITISIIYFLVLKEKNSLAGFFAAFIYAIMPFFVFYNRVILPEVTALGLIMLSIFFLYFISKELSNKNLFFYFLSLIFFSLAILTKPTTIFFIFSIVYLFYRNFKIKFLQNFWFYLYIILSLIPFILWRNYILKHPEGIPANEWLITEVNTANGLMKIFFKPAFFRWIFFERINNLILGGYLTIFFILGIIIKNKKFFLNSFLISSLSYLFFFQGGNVQHEYYQILILPTLAIFTGIGINFIIENKKIFNQILFLPLIFLIIVFSWFFSFYSIKNNYNYSNELVKQAKIINDLTKSTDKIVVDKMGDTTLLYLADRKGAPAIYKDPQELKKLGYQYLITDNQDQITNMINQQFQFIFKNNRFYIFKL